MYLLAKRAFFLNMLFNQIYSRVNYLVRIKECFA
jgi:hypothetical protein